MDKKERKKERKKEKQTNKEFLLIQIDTNIKFCDIYSFNPKIKIDQYN